MLTAAYTKELLAHVTYKPGWSILLGDDGSRLYLQVAASTLDSVNLTELVPWKSAKHYLSLHMCKQEIIGMAHHAIVKAELHEVNEFFATRVRASSTRIWTPTCSLKLPVGRAPSTCAPMR